MASSSAYVPALSIAGYREVARLPAEELELLELRKAECHRVKSALAHSKLLQAVPTLFEMCKEIDKDGTQRLACGVLLWAETQQLTEVLNRQLMIVQYRATQAGFEEVMKAKRSALDGMGIDSFAARDVEEAEEVSQPGEVNTERSSSLLKGFFEYHAARAQQEKAMHRDPDLRCADDPFFNMEKAMRAKILQKIREETREEQYKIGDSANDPAADATAAFSCRIAQHMAQRQAAAAKIQRARRAVLAARQAAAAARIERAARRQAAVARIQRAFRNWLALAGGVAARRA